MIGAYSFLLDGQTVPWLRMWMQWDAHFYLSILRDGYRWPIFVTGLESGQSNINFFPMLAIGAWPLARVLPPVPAALTFANLCLIAAAAVMHRLAQRRFGPGAGDWTVLSIMALPGSFALSSFMTEPLFLLLSAGAALLALNGRRAASAASMALLTVTRLTGCVLAAGFALDWLLARWRGRPASYRDLLLLCLTPLPLLAFMAYMFGLTGDALAPLHSNFAFWHQVIGVPFQNFAMLFWLRDPRSQIQSAVGLVMLAVLLSQWRQFTPGEWMYVALSMFSFASTLATSPSLIRYMLALYPLHLGMGRLCARRSTGRLLLVVLACVDGALMVAWAHGRDLYV